LYSKIDPLLVLEMEAVVFHCYALSRSPSWGGVS
jgi:hypothetical protein